MESEEVFILLRMNQRHVICKHGIPIHHTVLHKWKCPLLYFAIRTFRNNSHVYSEMTIPHLLFDGCSHGWLLAFALYGQLPHWNPWRENRERISQVNIRTEAVIPAWELDSISGGKRCNVCERRNPGGCTDSSWTIFASCALGIGATARSCADHANVWRCVPESKRQTSKARTQFEGEPSLYMSTCRSSRK